MPAFTQGEIWAEHGIGVAPAMRDRLKTQLDVNVNAMAAGKRAGLASRHELPCSAQWTLLS